MAGTSSPSIFAALVAVAVSHAPVIWQMGMCTSKAPIPLMAL